MSEFVSVLDMMSDAPYGAIRETRDAVAAMDGEIRRAMDAGLAPNEMATAREVRNAVQAAAVILDKIF